MSFNSKLLLFPIFFVLGALIMYLYMNHAMQSLQTQTSKILSLDQKLIDNGKNEGLELLGCRAVGCSVMTFTQVWGKYDSQRQELEKEKATALKTIQ